MKNLIKLIFLGTAGYHPTERRQTVSVMIPSKGFILDAGTGFFRVRNYIETSKLHIFLSHPHQDHIIGLTYYLGVLHEKGLGEKDITVYGLESHLEIIQEAFRGPIFDLPFKANFQPIPLEEKFTVRDVEIQAISLPHKGNVTIGYKFHFPEDKSLSYITDTICSSSYKDFIQDVDLLIHECYLPDKYEKSADEFGHSWTSGVNSLAIEACVKKLAVIHFNPVRDSEDPTEQINARVKFPGIIVPQDLTALYF